MKKTVVLCDKCGKEISGDYLAVEYKGKNYDICEECADLFFLTKEESTPAATTCCAPAPEHKDVDWDEVLDSVDAGKKKADSQVGG